MSTHDYVINNQSAAAFRDDLNAALAAIVTQNSNAVAPTTTFANMIWYDTTNHQLKKRNEAGTGWITLGTFNEGAGTFTPSGERALASQAQAEAGTDNATLMTPLRVAQAIDSLTPSAMTLLGTMSTTSGSSVTLSGLDLTGYSAVVLEIDKVNIPSSTTSAYLRFGVSSDVRFSEDWGGVVTGKWGGIATIMLGSGTFSAVVASMGGTSVSALRSDDCVPYAGLTDIRNSSTSITVGINTGAFASGSIHVYGV